MRDDSLTADARSRVEIDRHMVAFAWVVQDRPELNIYARQGVAGREFIVPAVRSKADYALFVDGNAVGAVSAKPSGTHLARVESLSARYADGLQRDLPALASLLPFLCKSSRDETVSIDEFGREPRCRPVVTLQRPQAPARWLLHPIDDAEAGPLRVWLHRLRPVQSDGLRRIRVEAIGRVEASMCQNHRRAARVTIASPHRTWAER